MSMINPLRKEYKSRCKLIDIAVYLHYTNKTATASTFEGNFQDGLCYIDFITQTKTSVSSELMITPKTLTGALKRLGIKTTAHNDRDGFSRTSTARLQTQRDIILPHFVLGLSPEDNLKANALIVLIKVLKADKKKPSYLLAKDLGLSKDVIDRYLPAIFDKI